jgi:hypothetical protein
MLKFDDQFTIHRKVSGLTDAAFRLHVEAIFWCARNLTDGFIAQDDLAIVSRYRRPEGYVTELVGRGAWDVVDGGWHIHDYLVWQQSRSKTLQVRDARKKSGTLGGIRSGESRRKPRGKPKQDASTPLEPPSPLAPPTGGLGRGSAAGRSARQPHVFDESPNSPGWCSCDMPRANKIHTVGGKA